MKVLIPNLGSTSLKYQLIETDEEKVLARGKIDRIGGEESQIVAWEKGMRAESRTAARIPDHRAAIKVLIDHLARLGAGKAPGGEISAVGFKAVHGGPRYCGTFLIDDALLAAMQEFVPVAPMHNPIYIQAMEIFRELLSGVPMVAVFETGFHATIPEKARAYGVPQAWRETYGIRRYGFHGSSHRYIARRVSELLPDTREEFRLISCHLGGSSSICAIRGGKSVDTSMGFSPQSGLEQSSRPGDLDPFVVFYVMEKEGLTSAQAARLLGEQGGLLGISGISNDIRDIEKAAGEGHSAAALALEVFVYEVKKYIGAYAAAMEGLDAVAFAGGIGENSAGIRRQICNGLDFLGVRLDDESNRQLTRGDRVISISGSPVKLLVICTNEEIVVARETARLLSLACAA
jgi:acetate kinase